MVKHIFQRNGGSPITVRTDCGDVDIPLHYIKTLEPHDTNIHEFKSITMKCGDVINVYSYSR